MGNDGGLLGPGDLLPGMTLADTRQGTTVAWCRSGEASVVVLPHAGPCDACRAYLGRLAGVTEDLASWGARPLLVLPSDGDVPGGLPFPALDDPGGGARARCGVGPDEAAVVMADRWGAVVESVAAGDGHGFPEPALLVRRAMNLGIACPECGVADGGWATVSPVPLG